MVGLSYYPIFSLWTLFFIMLLFYYLQEKNMSLTSNLKDKNSIIK